MTIYAIIETGGKQFKVSPGQVITVPLQQTEEGKKVEIERVLLISDGTNVTAGTPLVEGAKVIATAKGDGKGKKVAVMRYKSKTRYNKQTGHRQSYTKLAIEQIVAPGMAEEKPAKKRTRRAVKKEVKEVTEYGA